MIVAEFRYRPTCTAPWTRNYGHVGYNVRPSRRRQGHATVGLRLLIEVATADGLDGVAITIDPDNVASRKVVAANGGSLRTLAAEVEEPNGQDLWWLPVAEKERAS